MKVLIVTKVMMPPMMNGPAILMKNLLKHFPPDSYMVLMEEPENSSRRLDPASKLNCEYFFVHPIRLWDRLARSRFGQTLSAVCEFLTVPFVIFRSLRIARDHKVDAILVLPQTGGFELAGFLLHKITGIPMFVHVFDMYYAPGRLDAMRRCVAKVLEKLLLMEATKVFVMSEPLQEHYHQRYGVCPVMLPHPVDLSLYQNRERVSKANHERHYKIVFTGMIYEAQMDAIRNVAQAVNSLTEMDVRLILYTPVSPGKLANWGIGGSRVEYNFIPHHEIPTVQMSADLLLLPMAFDSPYPDVIRTALPSKMPEYLAAGKPILVHAPGYSYIAMHAREREWGLVVDVPDIEKLRQAIKQLRNQSGLGERLIRNALSLSRKYDACYVSRQLQRHLNPVHRTSLG